MRKLALITLLLAGCLRFSQVAESSAAERLNVIVIVVDDLGWGDLACYGSDLHDTPNIDRLATQAVRFTDAYAAAGICSPTRAALMTGKYPARLGMTIWHEWAVRGPAKNRRLIPPEAVANLPRSEITLAEVLRDAGYQTWHVGKWHLGNAEYYPETQGFDVNIGGALWGAPPTYFWPYRGPFDTELRYVPSLHGGKNGEYLTDRLTSEALKLIESSSDRPFYLNLCFHSVHTPIEGKPELVAHYEKKLASSNAKKHRHPAYAAMVHSMDENVGRVLKKLDELQLSERTLVILTSDNGGVVHNTQWGVVTNNAPFRSGKGSLYEGGVRVPLLMRGPGLSRGRVSHALASTQDFYPTILELLGLQTPPDHGPMDGISLTGVLSDPQASLPRDSLYWHYPHYYPTTTPVSAMRQGSHKLLHFYEDDRVELYDLASDPGERRNLADEQPETAARLRVQLDGWLSDVGARLPRPNPDKR